MVTVYTIADARFFLGLVALVNSLRLTGHRDEIVVLDAGMTDAQRELARPHCTLVPAPDRGFLNASVLKAYAPRQEPRTGVAALIDSDTIVTRSLAGVVSLAREGRICAHRDPDFDRWYPEWTETFGLRASLRRQDYVSANFVVFSTDRHPGLFGRWWSASERVLTHPSLYEGATGPTSQIDQDALNAVLMSEVPTEAVHLLPYPERATSVDAGWVRVVDSRSLACRFRYHDTMIIHMDGNPKPWEPAARQTVRRDAFVRLMRRLLWSPDVELRVPPAEVASPWLAPGRRGRAVLRALSARNTSPRQLSATHLAARVLPEPAHKHAKALITAGRRTAPRS